MRLVRAGLAGVALLVLVGCTDIAAAAPSRPAAAVVEVPAEPTPYDQWASTYAHRLGFLTCTRLHESPGRRIHPYEDGYPYNTGNGYFGAYQFDRRTWAGAIARAGYPYLSWNLPSNVPMKYQDLAAIQLFRERGPQPWGGRCSEWAYRQSNGVWAFR